MTTSPLDAEQMRTRVARHPRALLSHLPTPLDPLPTLTRDLGGAALFCKRDDCTGLAFGGNKARQLEFHFGRAQEQGADTILITGAVQSNYVRTAAAGAARLGLQCEVQLEDRVADMPTDYLNGGNVLLDRLFGATVHRFPVGEDESAADAVLDERANRLQETGRHPYVIHLGEGHSPVGALGYVLAAAELLEDFVAIGTPMSDVVVASGSASTHAGVLVGLRALGHDATVHGICVRRDAKQQHGRVQRAVRAVETLLGLDHVVDDADVITLDDWFGKGYGRPDDSTLEAMRLAAQREGLVLDPVYTGKAFAGLIGLVRSGRIPADANAVFIHTGGTPALFAYQSLLAEAFSG